jgi:hypothetical protein
VFHRALHHAHQSRSMKKCPWGVLVRGAPFFRHSEARMEYRSRHSNSAVVSKTCSPDGNNSSGTPSWKERGALGCYLIN